MNIIIHRQTVSLYHSRDTQDALSLVRNPSNIVRLSILPLPPYKATAVSWVIYKTFFFFFVGPKRKKK